MSVLLLLCEHYRAGWPYTAVTRGCAQGMWLAPAVVGLGVVCIALDDFGLTMVLTKKILDAKSLQMYQTLMFGIHGSCHGFHGFLPGRDHGSWMRSGAWSPRWRQLGSFGWMCFESFQSHLQRAATRSQKMWTCDRNSDVHHGAYKPCVVAESYMCVYIYIHVYHGYCTSWYFQKWKSWMLDVGLPDAQVLRFVRCQCSGVQPSNE